MDNTEIAARKKAKSDTNAEIDAQVKLRRERFNKSTEHPEERLTEDAEEKWGLALSGGGIRSATFCFGLLRALANQRSLLRFDLLSTVSGGGYIGTMLGCLFNRARNDGTEARKVEEAIDGLHGRHHLHAKPARTSDARGEKPTAWFLWWLRANGRYLIPRGMKDTIFAVALYLRNLAGIHLELGLVAVCLGLSLAFMDLVVWWALRAGGFLYASTAYFATLSWLPGWCPTVALLLPFFAFSAARVASAYWAVPWAHATLAWATPPVTAESCADRRPTPGYRDNAASP